ncbi:branched-chain amino acid transporter permease [Nocardiopsis suaedae]|uniref:AzlD domain-containing protein n=1 Tax=Nocardiopsis suaedae TaxID=3018444 RepID=A0ABT4TSE0_9ACTN|nr:AzlD domain-containing protein [Nocardiopsis suaedae]MDA2807611.1 AzlD domain-containing protein [Nocardiopsis suaedae]
MTETGYLLAAVAVCAGITWALRALPFALLSRLRDSPVVAYLDTAMPLGVMVILAAYTLRGVDWGASASLVPTVSALAVTVGLHLWLRNAVASIFAGTAVYVAVLALVF